MKTIYYIFRHIPRGFETVFESESMLEVSAEFDRMLSINPDDAIEMDVCDEYSQEEICEMRLSLSIPL